MNSLLANFFTARDSKASRTSPMAFICGLKIIYYLFNREVIRLAYELSKICLLSSYELQDAESKLSINIRATLNNSCNCVYVFI